MKRSESGFTLIEMLISIAIVTFVLAAASAFFIMSVRQYKVQTKIVESNIEGVIGLEMLRRDLDGLGFGLPWNNLPSYSERNTASIPSALANLNDSSNVAPRAVMSANNPPSSVTVNGSDYLVIKSATVGMGDPAGKWTTLIQSGTTRDWTPSAENLTSNDYVIVLSIGSVDSDRRSLVNPSSPYALFSPVLPSAYRPVEPYSANIVYGIGSELPVRPFNRAEYYIANAASDPPVTVPRWCAPNTGVLVKAVVKHDANGTIPDNNVFPLLDCVADMQVVFGRDTNADGVVEIWSDDISTGFSAADIRAQVIEVRTSILAHDGVRDDTYTHSTSSIYVGLPGAGRDFSIGSNTNYRWKLYNIVTKPRSLAQ